MKEVQIYAVFLLNYIFNNLIFNESQCYSWGVMNHSDGFITYIHQFMFWTTQADLETFLPSSLPAPQANPVCKSVWIARISELGVLSEGRPYITRKRHDCTLLVRTVTRESHCIASHPALNPLYPITTTAHWASPSISVRLGFLLCKTGVVRVPSSLGCGKGSVIECIASPQHGAWHKTHTQ